jgi:CheY-like chemotaxis protein
LKTILIVEDMYTIRVFIRALLGKGWNFLEASDGEEALKILAANAPDLILTDVEMPKVDGIELCLKVRADPRLAAVPVILITGKPTEELRRRATEVGVNDFLTKPINADLLATTLAKYVKGEADG